MLGVCFLFLGAYLLMSKPSSPQPKPTEEQPKPFIFGCIPQSKPVEEQPKAFTFDCVPQSKPAEVQPKSFFDYPQSKPVEVQPMVTIGCSPQSKSKPLKKLSYLGSLVRFLVNFNLFLRLLKWFLSLSLTQTRKPR